MMDPFWLNHVGTNVLKVDSTFVDKKRSKGVPFAALHRNDPMKCRALLKYLLHCPVSSLRNIKASLIAFQITPLYCSHCPLPKAL